MARWTYSLKIYRLLTGGLSLHYTALPPPGGQPLLAKEECHGPASQMALGIPHPRAHHLHDQQFPGAMPRGVYERMKSYADSWGLRGVRAWEEGWWDMAVRTGDGIGSLIGAGRGEISLHQNVTIIQAVISSCFDFRGPRNKVVLVDLEFPSIQYFYNEQARFGARVETIPSDDGIRIPLEKVLAAIDETTLLVPISLVLFRSSTI